MSEQTSTSKTVQASLLVALFIMLEIALVLFADRPLTAAIRHLEVAEPKLIEAFKAITDGGKAHWYLYPSGIGFLICIALTRVPKIRASAQANALLATTGVKLAAFFAVIAASGLITDGLKWVIGRARPVLDLQNQIYEFQPLSGDSRWNSMPSGHATTSIALAISLCFLWPQGRALWLALGGLLAASRVMVCAHFLSDILAGGMIAALTANQLLHSGKNHGILPYVRRLFPIDGQARGCVATRGAQAEQIGMCINDARQVATPSLRKVSKRISRIEET